MIFDLYFWGHAICANQQITQTSTSFVNEDWWRGECLFEVARGLENAQMFPYNRSRVRKSGIEGDNEWYSYSSCSATTYHIHLFQICKLLC